MRGFYDPEGKAIILVHVVGMKLDLYCLLNEAVN